MLQRRRFARWLLVAGALFAMVSCDSGPRRMGVSGSVTFRGAPLKDGTITFIPLATKTQSGTSIVDGKFAISSDKGLEPGTYRVSISSPDGNTPVDPNTPPGPSGNFTSKERIPADFNENSKREVEVTLSGPNRFEFQIP